MNAASQIVGADTRKRTLSLGLVITAATALSALLFLVDVRLAFAPPGILTACWIAKGLRVGEAIPRTKVGWLYASVIFLTCLAPSLGTVGTVARFALAGVVFIVLIYLQSKDDPGLPTSLKVGIAILMLSLIISTIGAASAAYGIARLLNWTMFLPALWLAYRRPDVRGMAFGIIVTCLFQMAGVGLQMLGLMGGTWGGLLISGTTYNPETSSWLTRYTGFIANPNNLALLLACGIIVLAACMLSNIPTRLKLTSLGLICLFSAGVVLTGSRGGLVAVTLGVLVLFMAAGRRGMALGILAAGIALAVLQFGASQQLDRVVASFGQILSGGDASAVQRSSLWLARFGTAQEGGLALGSGFGGYAPGLFSDQQGLDVDPKAARLATVDSAWLKMLLESGILGLTAMAITLLHPMLGSVIKSSGSSRLWGITAGSILVAIVWRSLSVDMLDQNPWNAVIFLTVGLAAASHGTGPAPADATSPNHDRIFAFATPQKRQ
jgi:O-antigen ligase